MNNDKFNQLQRALGVSALAWSTFLLPGTSFLWWIGGSAIYGGLALTAAAINDRGDPAKGRLLAIVGMVIFAASNGSAAFLACTAGGACTLVVAVLSVILPAQLAIVIFAPRRLVDPAKHTPQ